MLNKQRVPEGTWFCVPLKGGRVAVGVVARSSPGLGIVVGHFFGPARPAAPTLDEVRALRPEDAVTVCRVGSVGITRGVWPLIGQDPSFERALWTTPVFVRALPRGHGSLVVRYDEDDPKRVVEERPCDAPPPGRTFRDGLTGHLVVEITLEKMLSGS